jgi:hypothetical protein
VFVVKQRRAPRAIISQTTHELKLETGLYKAARDAYVTATATSTTKLSTFTTPVIPSHGVILAKKLALSYCSVLCCNVFCFSFTMLARKVCLIILI